MHVNQVRVTDSRQREAWEEKASSWKIEDIGEEKFNNWLKQMAESGYMYVKDGQSVQLSGERFITKQGYLKNGAALFLVDTDLCEIQLAVCEDNTRSHVLESQRVHGTLPAVIQAAEDFIECRTERYPHSVIYELLLNAFEHRDFNSTQCNEVLIYENRIEIFNPGEFPEGYKAEDFTVRGQRPVPRNPMIARILYYTGCTDGMGIGLKQSEEMCSQENSGIGIMFQQDKGGFAAVLTGGRMKSTQEESADLNKNEILVVRYVQEHGSVTNASAREIVGVGTTATRNLLNGLVDKGILIAEGENRGRKYCLTDAPFSGYTE